MAQKRIKKMEKELILNNLLDSLVNFINSYSRISIEYYFPTSIHGVVESNQIKDILYVILDERNNILDYTMYKDDTIHKIKKIIKLCELAGQECKIEL